MKNIYLETGQEAQLIKKIDDKNYLVEPMVDCVDYDTGEEYTEPGEWHRRLVVSRILKAPPVEKIQEECRRLDEKRQEIVISIESLNKQISTARQELQKLQSTKTNVANMIYDRSALRKAKRITVFVKDKIVPLDTKLRGGLKLHFEVGIIKGEERIWGAEYWDDSSGWGTSHFLDSDYDLMLDFTDEEILKAARVRASEKEPKFSDYELMQVPDEYLSPKFIMKKNALRKKKAQKEIATLKKKIAADQLKLKKLLTGGRRGTNAM